MVHDILLKDFLNNMNKRGVDIDKLTIEKEKEKKEASEMKKDFNPELNGIRLTETIKFAKLDEFQAQVKAAKVKDYTDTPVTVVLDLLYIQLNRIIKFRYTDDKVKGLDGSIYELKDTEDIFYQKNAQRVAVQKSVEIALTEMLIFPDKQIVTAISTDLRKFKSDFGDKLDEGVLMVVLLDYLDYIKETTEFANLVVSATRRAERQRLG